MTERPSGSDLCVDCRLCCSGALYLWAKLKPEEPPRVAAEGLATVTGADGRVHLALPCAALSAESGCTIYDRRFHVCRSYRCKLLVKVEAGEETLDAARETVRMMRSEIAELKRLTAQEPGETLDRGAFVDLAGEDGPKGAHVRRRNAAALLQLAKVEHLKRKHFDDRAAGGEAPPPQPGAPPCEE